MSTPSNRPPDVSTAAAKLLVERSSLMARLLVRAMADLVEVNELLGASPEEAFRLAFGQVLLATWEELELLAGE